MVPKRCRSRIGIYSETCSYARGGLSLKWGTGNRWSSITAWELKTVFYQEGRNAAQCMSVNPIKTLYQRFN